MPSSLKRIKRQVEYEFWRACGCNDSYTAKEFSVNRATVRDWRALEEWDQHVSRDESKLAKALVLQRETRIHKYAQDSHERMEMAAAVIGHELEKLFSLQQMGKEAIMQAIGEASEQGHADTAALLEGIFGADVSSKEVLNLVKSEEALQRAYRTLLGLDNVKIGIDHLVTIASDTTAIRQRIADKLGLTVIETAGRVVGEEDAG